MEKHEDVLEMTSQFMEANEVEEFTNIDGNMLVQPNEDLFFKLNEKKAIFSWRTLKKFVDMMEQLTKSVARMWSSPKDTPDAHTLLQQ